MVVVVVCGCGGGWWSLLVFDSDVIVFADPWLVWCH